MSYIKRAFPSSTDGEDYLEHCPPEFDKSVLKKFSQRSHSAKAKLLFNKAKSFQKKVVKSWNPNIENRTKSVCIGLVDIDESASMPNGAITLDLLIRSGVLVMGENGNWRLADD